MIYLSATFTFAHGLFIYPCPELTNVAMMVLSSPQNDIAVYIGV